ncbi:hypothetical protein IWW50_001510 [Coemansia erecta]|nr:hypothetical protein IWW50_001510 [Coemansia erecta]
MQSPTVPSNLFVGDSPTSMGPVLSLEQTLSTLAASLEPPKRGSYTLNPAFMRSWEENNPPVPQLPKVSGGSFPARIKAPVPAEKPISFPHPGDESWPNKCAIAPPPPLPHNVTLPPPPPQVTAQPEPSAPPMPMPMPTGRNILRGPSIRQQPVLYPKRNYSLPAALAPPLPKLKLENYEFTSIESLERKWEESKTETTRLLSSAIYNYYFSHGEWQEFEQVFPGKVLEAWSEFHNKLTPSELGFVNTVLVSQNPFSSDQGNHEKHIPALARTIPLSQVVRTMVLSEDMQSRESYSSQNSNGPEIDLEFADWLITRFNSKKTNTASSPFENQQDASKPEKLQGTLEPQNPQKVPQPEKVQGNPQPEQPKQTPVPEKSAPKTPSPPPVQQLPAHKSLGLWTSASESKRPTTAVNFMDINSGDEQDKPRRKNTITGRTSEAPAPKQRRPTINLPSVFQSWRKGSSKTNTTALDDMINLPPSPKQKRPDTAAKPSSSKSRRHTHNFFASSTSAVEPRVSLDSTRSSRRATREIQMKDLPPLPPNAAEISQMSRIGAESKIKVSHSASVLRKGSSMLTHFSSHTDLGQRMAAVFDKPRSSSLIAENAEKPRRQPSIAAPSMRESTSSKGSRSRESGSTEIVSMVYEWRPTPQHGDCNWGFTISPLALKQPLGRKKSNAAMYVVNSHTPTMNHRVLPEPQKPEDAPNKPQPPADAPSKSQSPVNASEKPLKRNPSKPATKLTASRSMPESRQIQKSQSPDVTKENGQESRLVPPELPKTKMPQSQLGLGISKGAKPKGAAPNAAMAGVRGVLYELAYLSTQGKNVWSKSDHIFANMGKTGLEVNRIAEQDFFDFCVDELLKYSSEASQDLQAMGNKKMAKKLYESFNAKLSILLADSVL